MAGRFWLVNLKNFGDDPLDAEKYFGKDTAILFECCSKILENALKNFKGCKSYNWEDIRKIRQERKVGAKEAIEIYRDENPEKVKRVEESQKRWKEENERLFKIVYGIARRHHIFLDWLGNADPYCPDEWEVYKKGKKVGRICL